MSTIIATQGEPGSFHHQAVRQFFGNDTEILCAEHFGGAVELLTAKAAEYAVVAIENSLYGSINTVYDLLLHEPVTICGEIYLRIEQNIIGLPKTKLSDIREVHSHPVALAQCESFLDTQLPNAKRFEHYDTAASVADIKEWNDPSKAAIASLDAATLHGMQVLVSGIETNKQNYTRFVILERENSTADKTADKTSIILQMPQDSRAGSLYRALGVFAKNNINLYALHSRPIIGRAWHYMFYLDIAIGPGDKKYSDVFKVLTEQGCQVDILGSYKNAML